MNPFSLPVALRTQAIYLLLVALVAWVYLGEVTDLGLHIHDADTFKDNKAISHHFGYFFAPDKAQASGRPVAEGVKWLAYLAGGNNPAWFHALVVALHAGAVLLLSVLLIHLGLPPRTSALAGLLFLVNTSYSNAVHMISSLDYSLALVFGLAGLLCYLQWNKAGGSGALIGTLLFLGLGVGAHPGLAFVVPWGLYWAKQAGRTLQSLALQLGLSILVGLGWVALSLWRTASNTTVWGTIDEAARTSFVDLVANSIHLLLWFLGRLLLHAHWMALALGRQSPTEWAVGALVLLGLGLLLWRGPASLNRWGVWILLSLLPFVLLHPDFVLPYPLEISRYLYWTSVGTAVLFAVLLEYIAIRAEAYRPQAGRWVLAGLTALVLGSSYNTGQKNLGLSHFVSGRFHYAQEEYPQAQVQLNRAQQRGADRLIPEDFLHISQSIRLHRPPNAFHLPTLLAEWQALLRQRPDSFLGHYYAGLTYHALAKDLPRALVHLTRSTALNPTYPPSMHALAKAHRETGNLAQAQIAWEKLIRLEPDNTDYLCNLGIFYYSDLNNVEQALLHWKKALAVDPDHQLAHTNLAVAYYFRADYHRAIPHLEALIRLTPTTLKHYLDLGDYYRRIGRYQDAAHIWQRAAQVDPEDPRPLYLLGLVYLEHLDQVQKARTAFNQFLRKAPDHVDAPKVRNWLKLIE